MVEIIFSKNVNFSNFIKQLIKFFLLQIYTPTLDPSLIGFTTTGNFILHFSLNSLDGLKVILLPLRFLTVISFFTTIYFLKQLS